jgi:hypothetical protein
MFANRALIFTVSGLLATGLVPALGQQVADPKFDAKVARPAYTTNGPRVLLDEAHFNVHTSKGSYKAFAELVANDGYEVVANTRPFSADSLAGARVLVISNARGAAMRSEKPAFQEAECDAVRDWVRDGGALLLITDHYPTGHAAEGLARRFDVTLSKGRTIDPAHTAPGAGGPGALQFRRDDQLLGDHAITQGRDASERINRVVTFGGASLKGPEGSTALLKLSDSAVDILPFDGNKRVSAAGSSQGLALTFGKGRVVMLGEASQLSAQRAGPQGRAMGMNLAGTDNRQWVLNLMHWLSGLLEPPAAAGGNGRG